MDPTTPRPKGVLVAFQAACNASMVFEPHCTLFFFGRTDERSIESPDEFMNWYLKQKDKLDFVIPTPESPLSVPIRDVKRFGAYEEKVVAVLDPIYMSSVYNPLKQIFDKFGIDTTFPYNPHITLGEIGTIYEPIAYNIIGQRAYLHTPQLWYEDMRFDL